MRRTTVRQLPSFGYASEALQAAASSIQENALPVLLSTVEHIQNALFPGFCLFKRLSYFERFRLFGAWLFRIASEASTGFFFSKLPTLFLSLITANPLMLGSSGLMALLPFIMFNVKSVVTRYVCRIHAIESNYAASLAEDVFRALRMRPEIYPRKKGQEVRSLLRHVRALVSGQMNISYANSIAPFILSFSGAGLWEKTGLVCFFLLKVVLSLWDEGLDAGEGFIMLMQEVRAKIRRLECGLHLGGRAEFENEIISNHIKETNKSRQNSESWSAYFAKAPLMLIPEVIRFLLKGLTHLTPTSVSNFVTAVSLKWSNKDSVYFSTQKMKEMSRGMKHVQVLENFVKETKAMVTIVKPNSRYYREQQNLMVRGVTCCVGLEHDGLKCLYNNVTASLPIGVNLLTGPNGSGKSTLMRMLAGEAKPQAGGVFLGEIKTCCLSPESRERVITYVPQEMEYKDEYPPLFNVLYFSGEAMFPDDQLKEASTYKEYEHLRAAYRNHQAVRYIFRIARELEIDDLLRKNDCMTLSGGEKKMLLFLVVVLRVRYLRSTKVVLLDEITAGMDSENVQKVVRLISTFPQRGVSVVTIFHENGIFAGENANRLGRHYRVNNQSLEEVPH